MRANGHIAVGDFDLSKQAHPVGPRIIQQQMRLSDKIKRSLSLSKSRGSSSSLVNLDIVNSEPVLPYQTNSFVGYVSLAQGVRICTLEAWAMDEVGGRACMPGDCYVFLSV